MRISSLVLAIGLPFAVPTPAQDVVQIWHGQNGDSFGTSLVALGDVDLDGDVDFAVGAPDRNGGVGAVDFLSADGGLLRTLNGTAANDRFGQALALAGDIDRDGSTDLWVLSATSLQAFSGREGARLFQYPATNLFAALGDYDGDGHDDTVFANADYDLVVRSGRDGSVLLRLVMTGVPIAQLAACGDVDGDGHADVMTTRVAEMVPLRMVDVWSLQRGLSIFQATGTDPGFGVQIGGAGDVDRDGRADFFVHAGEYVTPTPYSNNGITWVYSGATLTEVLRDTGVISCYHATCTRILRQNGYAALPSDIDGDGQRERLAVCALWGAAQVRVKRNGDTILRLPGTAIQPAGDVDRDGLGDHVLARNGEVWLVSAGRTARQHFGVRQFGDRVYGCYPCADVDGDGIDDFYVSSGYANVPGMPWASTSVFSGSNGQGLWTFTRNPTLGPVRIVLATGGDLDGNGLCDIAVTGYGGREIAVFGGMASSSTPTLVIRDTDATAALALGADWDGDTFGDVFCASATVIELRSGGGGALFASLPFGAQELKLIGDVDGDGIADLLADTHIIGSVRREVLRTLASLPVAFVADHNGDRRADAWTVTGDQLVLVSGVNGALIRQLPAPAGGNIAALAAGLDWNADGWGDLLVGQPTWQGFGRAAVLSGLDGRILHTEWGEAAGDEFGSVVGMLGNNGSVAAGPALVAGALHGELTNQGYGRRAQLVASPAAVNVHGRACGIGEIRPLLQWDGGAPRLGGTFMLQTYGIAADTASIVVFGTSEDAFGMLALPAILGSLGMPGCVLYVGPEVQFATLANASGRVALPLTIPDVPAILGMRVFSQTLTLEPRANQLGVLASDAIRIVLGR